ncbi:DUF262 domain-containing protein [Cetobacterium sp.]|uniref:DUF262 domain-containing protein n=1 Tax=Cetobacterium sp. TaxID=2071632 RepID=UPI003F412151
MEYQSRQELSQKLNELLDKNKDDIEDVEDIKEIIIEGTEEEIKLKYEELLKLLSKNESEVFNNYISKTTSYSEVSYEIEYLIDEFSKQKIQMPEFQRMYVWDKKKVGEFILSILRDIPIPKLYAYSSREEEKQRNIKLIIDGQQRLTSLLMYYYGVFPKYKVRKINYSENMNEIVKYCNYYYYPEVYEREILRLNLENIELDKRLEEIKNAKNILEQKFKLTVDEVFEVDIFDSENNKKTLNISYRVGERNKSILTEKQRSKILTKELGFILVKGDNPSEAVDIFRLYNSAGSPLTAQEIRNGIYYKNLLYKKINDYNKETGRVPGSKKVKNEIWNRIRTKQSGQEDIKQLFKFLSYYYNLEDKLKYIFDEEKIITNDIIEEKSEEIINNYSDYISINGSNVEFLNMEFETLKRFFEITFEGTGKIKNYICIYIILKYFKILERENFDYSDIKISNEILNYDIKDSGLLSSIRLRELKKMLGEVIEVYAKCSGHSNR